MTNEEAAALAEEVIAGKTRSHVEAAKLFAEHILRTQKAPPAPADGEVSHITGCDCGECVEQRRNDAPPSGSFEAAAVRFAELATAKERDVHVENATEEAWNDLVRAREVSRSKATPMTGAEGDVPFESYEAAQRDPNEKRCRMVHLNDWTSSPDAFRCEDEKGHPGLCTFDRWDFRARIATPLFGKPISGACQEDKCPMRGWHHTHEPAQRGRPEASTLDEVAKLNARLVVAQDIILSLVRWTNSGDCPDCHPFRPAPSYPDWQHEEGCEHLADINRGLVFLGKQPQEGHALPDAKAEMQRLAQERRESAPPKKEDAP